MSEQILIAFEEENNKNVIPIYNEEQGDPKFYKLNGSNYIAEKLCICECPKCKSDENIKITRLIYSNGKFFYNIDGSRVYWWEIRCENPECLNHEGNKIIKGPGLFRVVNWWNEYAGKN